MEYHTERYEPDLWYLSIGGDPKKFYTLSKVIRAELAVKHIRKGLQLSLPENRLAFAVIKQAVADLAHIKPNGSGRVHGAYLLVSRRLCS